MKYKIYKRGDIGYMIYRTRALSINLSMHVDLEKNTPVLVLENKHRCTSIMTVLAKGTRVFVYSWDLSHERILSDSSDGILVIHDNSGKTP